MKKTAFLIPTLNAQEYFAEALLSILRQTYDAFDLFILDGGSTDATMDICQAFQRRDSRINLISSPNISPTARTDSALSNLGYDYFFLAHADDISTRHRAAHQLAFMEADPKLVLSGSNTHFWLHDKANDLNINHYSGFKIYPSTDADIRCQLPFWWSFSAASLIINGKLYRSNDMCLDDSLQVGSDWYFYWQAARIGRVANLQEPLVAYRHHHGSHGAMERQTIDRETKIIRDRIARQLKLDTFLSKTQFDTFLALGIEYEHVSRRGDYSDTTKLFGKLREWPADREGIEYPRWQKLIDSYAVQLK